MNRNDDAFSDASDANLAEMVINRLLLYLDDPYIKMRPILLGKHTEFSIFYDFFKYLYSFYMLSHYLRFSREICKEISERV